MRKLDYKLKSIFKFYLLILFFYNTGYGISAKDVLMAWQDEGISFGIAGKGAGTFMEGAGTLDFSPFALMDAFSGLRDANFISNERTKNETKEIGGVNYNLSKNRIAIANMAGYGGKSIVGWQMDFDKVNSDGVPLNFGGEADFANGRMVLSEKYLSRGLSGGDADGLSRAALGGVTASHEARHLELGNVGAFRGENEAYKTETEVFKNLVKQYGVEILDGIENSPIKDELAKEFKKEQAISIARTKLNDEQFKEWAENNGLAWTGMDRNTNVRPNIQIRNQRDRTDNSAWGLIGIYLLNLQIFGSKEYNEAGERQRAKEEMEKVFGQKKIDNNYMPPFYDENGDRHDPIYQTDKDGNKTLVGWKKMTGEGAGTVTNVIVKNKDDVVIRNKSLAGKQHPVTMVPFDEDGFPDFSKYLYKGGINDVVIQLTGDRLKDFDEANKKAKYTSTPKGYTWHHHQDIGRMQLVDTKIHSKTGHTGGFSLNKN